MNSPENNSEVQEPRGTRIVLFVLMAIPYIAAASFGALIVAVLAALFTGGEAVDGGSIWLLWAVSFSLVMLAFIVAPRTVEVVGDAAEA